MNAGLKEIVPNTMTSIRYRIHRNAGLTSNLYKKADSLPAAVVSVAICFIGYEDKTFSVMVSIPDI